MDNIFKNVFLETDRLILRNIVQEDKKDIFELYQDPSLNESFLVDRSMEEISGIIDWYIKHYDINTSENIIIFNLAIIIKNEQKVIGDIGIRNYPKDKSKNEIFILINSNYWNRGYASEATKVFLDYIKKNTLISTIFGALAPRNIASSKILIKNGFEKIEYDYIENEQKKDIDIYELKITK